MTHVVLISSTPLTDAGQATVASPAPARRHACPARTAAPDMPVEPATRRTFPQACLWASRARVGRATGGVGMVVVAKADRAGHIADLLTGEGETTDPGTGEPVPPVPVEPEVPEELVELRTTYADGKEAAVFTLTVCSVANRFR